MERPSDPPPAAATPSRADRRATSPDQRRTSRREHDGHRIAANPAATRNGICRHDRAGRRSKYIASRWTAAIRMNRGNSCPRPATASRTRRCPRATADQLVWRRGPTPPATPIADPVLPWTSLRRSGSRRTRTPRISTPRISTSERRPGASGDPQVGHGCSTVPTRPSAAGTPPGPATVTSAGVRPKSPCRSERFNALDPRADDDRASALVGRAATVADGAAGAALHARCVLALREPQGPGDRRTSHDDEWKLSAPSVGPGTSSSPSTNT